MSISFEIDSVSVESIRRDGLITVTAVGKGWKIAEALDLDDRLYELDVRDIIDHVGATEVLQAMTEEDLCDWLKSEETDPTDMLNAIGEDAVLEWLSNCGSDSNSPV